MLDPTDPDPDPSTRMAASDDAPRPTLDLRVARVAQAREHPDADRLLVLDIDLGDESRQIVAGLVGHYKPSELSGLSVVVVANLQPARLRGEISQGMLLAAEDEDEGRLGVLTAPDALPGVRVAPVGAGEPDPEVTFAEFQEHDLVAGPDGITLDGEPLTGTRLVVDRGVYGPVR